MDSTNKKRIDEVSLSRVEKLHPKIKDKVLAALLECSKVLTGKAIVRITQGLRTFAEQDALYAQGRTTKGPKVTNAKGGQSYHNYGLAIDYCLLIDKDGDGIFETVSWDMVKDFDDDKIADWKEVYNIFKKHGFASGADWKSFKDYPHFDMTFGYTTAQLLAKYKSGDFINSTKFVNI